MNQHYHPLRDTTTTSPIITDSTSQYYTHHRTAVSLFSPTNMNITPTSSSPFKPTATLSPYSSPSAIVCIGFFFDYIIYLFVYFRVFGNNQHQHPMLSMVLIIHIFENNVFFLISIKPFSPSSTTTADLIPTASTTNSLTTRFICSNRVKLVEFAAYVESKRDIDSVRN
jgi:hypothetical protein